MSHGSVIDRLVPGLAWLVVFYSLIFILLMEPDPLVPWNPLATTIFLGTGVAFGAAIVLAGKPISGPVIASLLPVTIGAIAMPCPYDNCQLSYFLAVLPGFYALGSSVTMVLVWFILTKWIRTNGASDQHADRGE